MSTREPDTRAPGSRSARARWVVRVALVLASSLVGLGAVEGILRVVGYEYRPFAVTRFGGNQPQTRALQSEAFVFDPYLLWAPRPNHGVFGDRGVRGPGVGPDDDRFRILVVGDSNTLGWIESTGANWPGDLRSHLPEEDFVLWNAASWGWSSFQGVRRLHELADLRPDLVILSFGANDAHHRGTSDSRFAERLEAFEPWAWSRTSRLVLATLDRIDRFRAPEPRVDPERFEANLRAAHRIVTGWGSDLVLATRPFREASENPRVWSHHTPEYNSIVRRLAEELDLRLVDHAAWAAGRWDLFTDSGHFTEFGHRAAGLLTYRVLRPSLPASDWESDRQILVNEWPRSSGLYFAEGLPQWSDGDAIFEGLEIPITAGDGLVVETRGWHPWRHDSARLWVEVRADGRLLEACHRAPDRFAFRLSPALDSIRWLRITSATFLAHEEFGSSDHRRLGLDLVRLQVVDARELATLCDGLTPNAGGRAASGTPG